MVRVVQIIHQNLQPLLLLGIYKKRRKKETKTASKANTQPCSEYCGVCTRIILIFYLVYMLSKRESK